MLPYCAAKNSYTWTLPHVGHETCKTKRKGSPLLGTIFNMIPWRNVTEKSNDVIKTTCAAETLTHRSNRMIHRSQSDVCARMKCGLRASRTSHPSRTHRAELKKKCRTPHAIRSLFSSKEVLSSTYKLTPNLC